MAYSQAYSAYKATGVKTASQGKLIVMLYEETVRRLDAALELYTEEHKIEAACIEKFHGHLAKAQEIITELMVSLDMERGGEIAQNLMALYTFFNRELIDICINHEREKLLSVRTMIHDLYSSWTAAAAGSASAQPASHPSVDLNG